MVIRFRSLIASVVLLSGVVAASASPAAAQATAKEVVLRAGTTVTKAGKLGKGVALDLAWAAKSSVACFPATRFSHFDGTHYFFKTHLPAKSVLKIRAIPAKPTTDLSLYAYSGPTSLPPAVESVVSCEASYGSNQLNAPYNPGATEAVELNATTNPYDVVVGVAGAQGLKAGDFTVEFELATAAAEPTGKITSAAPIAAVSGKSVTTAGKLESGAIIGLSWAANSSVACFPATSNEHFTGNHVVYTFDLPRYTTATVEVTPKAPTLDVSLYAYTVGPTFPALPPDVPSVVSCEASYGSNNINARHNPGATEKIELVAINNPYKAYVAVVGAQGVTAGAYDLKVTLAPR